MFIEIDLPDQAVVTTAITSGTTIAVTAIRVGGRVAIAWIESRRNDSPPLPSEVEPSDP